MRTLTEQEQFIELAGDLIDLIIDELSGDEPFISENFRDILTNILDKTSDFTIDDTWRFIHQDKIDKIMVSELGHDEYMLGCFYDEFIADNTDLSYDIVKSLQEANKYEAIGKHIIDNGYLDNFVKNYAEADGYAHYFSVYDGQTQIEFNKYFIFRI